MYVGDRGYTKRVCLADHIQPLLSGTMRRLLPLLLYFVHSSAFAGGDHLPLGARSAGMGYTGLTHTDLWSVRLNPAGMAGVERPVAGLLYQQHFLSNELAQQGLAAVIPVGKGAFGVSADRFGYSLYTESRVGVGYAMRFGDGLRAGIQLNHVGIRLGENYGNSSALTAELGVQARLTKELWLGAHLYNPTQALLGSTGEGGVVVEERVPTLLRVGLTYTFSTKLQMLVEAEKDIDQAERFRIGMEYNPNKVLFLRTGISTGPVQAHFGAGFRVKQLDIDLAMAVRSQLGPTPVIGINYRFK